MELLQPKAHFLDRENVPEEEDPSLATSFAIILDHRALPREAMTLNPVSPMEHLRGKGRQTGENNGIRGIRFSSRSPRENSLDPLAKISCWNSPRVGAEGRGEGKNAARVSQGHGLSSGFSRVLELTCLPRPSGGGSGGRAEEWRGSGALGVTFIGVPTL